MMKAVVYHQYGDAEVLEIEEVAQPKIGDDQLMIKVYASSVNPIDWKVRQGQLKVMSGFSFPNKLGCDFAGTVAAIGENVSGYYIGDEVYGTIDPVTGGAYGEYLAADLDHVAIKPASINFEEAASIPTVGLTAWQALVEKANISPGKKVLVNGCSGGVGIMAIQLAKTYDAEVTGVCSENGFALSKKMGADHLINYHEQDLMKITEKYDIFFDVIANQSFSIAKKLLNKGGTFVTTKPSPQKFIPNAINSWFSSKKFSFVLALSSTENLNTLRELIERGKLVTQIDKTFPLEEIKAAHAYSETMRTKGKIAIRINSQT